jgi:hypothetical protein
VAEQNPHRSCNARETLPHDTRPAGGQPHARYRRLRPQSQPHQKPDGKPAIYNPLLNTSSAYDKGRIQLFFYDLDNLDPLKAVAETQWGEMFLTFPPVQWMDSTSVDASDSIGPRAWWKVPGGVQVKHLASILEKKAEEQQAEMGLEGSRRRIWDPAD